MRLDRWTQDIADASDKLRYFAPAELLIAAEEAAVSHSDSQSAAEASWIKAALLTIANKQPSPHPSAPLQTKPFIDTDAEASWLVRVRSAYSEITTSQAQRVLARAEEGLVAHEPTR